MLPDRTLPHFKNSNKRKCSQPHAFFRYRCMLALSFWPLFPFISFKYFFIICHNVEWFSHSETCSLLTFFFFNLTMFAFYLRKKYIFLWYMNNTFLYSCSYQSLLTMKVSSIVVGLEHLVLLGYCFLRI